jgi:membrane associated rhomboid family serine protease/Tfp pilus assembly protein PilF
MPWTPFGKKICSWCVQHEAAQRGEERADAVQPVMTVPWARRQSSGMIVTQAIFGINVAVFLGMALASGEFVSFNPQLTVHWGANFGPATVSGEWWRLLTCVFLHGGILHIGFNMWCLWQLGALCESLYGHWTYAVVYLVSGVGASVASIIWKPQVLSVGASGAIFGIAGALIASFYLGEFSLPRAAISGVLRSLVMFAGYNLLFGAVSGVTDNGAHVGGLVTGLLLGALMAKIAPDSRNLPRRIAVLLAGSAVVAGGVLWIQQRGGWVTHVQRASMYIQQNKNDQAITELERVVRMEPAYLPAHFELGRLYAIKGDFTRAETELKSAIALDPKERSARYLLGLLYLDSKRPQEAKPIFAELLSRDPRSAEAHFGMGLVLAQQGACTDALKEYEQASVLDPELERVQLRKGLCLAELKRYDEAIAAYQKEQQANGDSHDLEIALADAYEGKGLVPKSEEAHRKAEALKSQP